MSFDIFVQGFSNGEGAEVDRDKFVAALGSTLLDDSDVETSDGGSAQIYGLDENPFDGCMFALHGDLSPELADLIIAAATAARCAIYWPSDSPLIAYPIPTMLKDLPSNLEAPTPVLCTTGAELRLLVTDGLEAWKGYRDQVISS